MSGKRAYDIIVFGATGVTGAYTVEYLARNAPKSVKWAAAARTKSKLEATLSRLGCSGVPMIIADNTDAASLDAACKQTTVAIACAGPFDLFGMPLVDACVRNKTHYIDITGEVPFIRATYSRDEAAKKNDIFLISCGGVDSVPSDVGNFVVHQNAPRDDPIVSVEAFVRFKGMLSGGTLASAANIVKKATKADMNPYALCPAGATKPRVSSVKFLGYSNEAKAWRAPFLMAMVNEAIVRRSNATLNPNATYREMIVGSFFQCFMNMVTLVVAMFALNVPPLRALVTRLWPAGSHKEVKDGFLNFRFQGRTQSNKIVEAKFVARNIDAYRLTGVLVAECALCIVLHGDQVSKNKGVHTPTTALGSTLVTRLNSTGIVTIDAK